MSTAIDMSTEEIEALMAELEMETEAAIKEEAPQGAASPAPDPTPSPVPEEADQMVAALEEQPQPAPEPERLPDPAPIAQAVISPAPPAANEPPAGSFAEPVTLAKRAAMGHDIDLDEFLAETAVSDTNLDTCMMQQASLRAYHGVKAAHAEAKASSVRKRFDVLEAKLYNEHRSRLVAEGEKATEKMIEAAVKADPRWIKGEQSIIDAEFFLNVNKACVRSLDDRKDMIVQLGADRREELKGQVRVMAERQERQSLGERAVAAAKAA